MIGATAIASSFVLFSTQVNVDRLPYGLFYRFSFDNKIFSAFALSFVAAIGGTALSLISDPSYASLLVVTEFAVVVIILRLLLLAYRRSLHLVNPLAQIRMIARRAEAELRRVERQIRWGFPSPGLGEGEIDSLRLAIFGANPGWDRNLRTAIDQTIAFARRAGERGDLTISAAALNSVLTLNESYVQVKGRTFFANNLLLENPLVSDGTINLTLESMRRLRESALQRGDEQQLEQILQTHAALVHTYLRIPYGRGQSKSHALLAAGYLEKVIEAALQRQLIDTAMGGIRLVSAVAQKFLISGEPTEAVSSISKISVYGMLGGAGEAYRPLTLVSMEELRDTLIVMLRVDGIDISYPSRQIRSAISEISTSFLQTSDMALTSNHSFYLGPFYSSTSLDSFRSKMTILVNALQSTSDAKSADAISRNLGIWSDGLYREQKGLLLDAITRRSHFAFDMIHWVTGVTELLMFASKAPHTNAFTSSKLEKNALWLFSVLTWIPIDKESVTFVENLSFRSEVFETALRADRDKWPDGYESAWNLMNKWAFEGGKYVTGWGTLERWLSALCALALKAKGPSRADQLKVEVAARLASPDAPNQELRDRAASDLREKAKALRHREFETDLVEQILASTDQKKTKNLLLDVAEMLSPLPS